MSPGAQPVDGHTSDSMAPSDADTSRRPDPSSSAPPPLRQIISNARGRYPQLEMVNFPRSPTKQRGGDQAQHVDTDVERLEGVSCSLLLVISQDEVDTFTLRWVSMKPRIRPCARSLRSTSLLMEANLRRRWRT